MISLRLKEMVSHVILIVTMSLWFIVDIEGDSDEKDWVFKNYTFKRFEGLTQRGMLRMQQT